jgi:GNAT superfamily N-acetyltransferase
MPADLVFRIEPFADPRQRAPWLDLLRDIFSIDLSAYSALDIWHPGYRAFSYWAGDVLVANVSIRPLPLLVAGRVVQAAQLHAVATRPDYRRRGLFTDLMARTLAYADGRFEALLLFTATCDLYKPFSFRHLPQHHFIGTLAAAPQTPAPNSRLLSLNDADDLALIRALHATRQPVSRHFSLADNVDVFIANALHHADWQLTFLPDHHALIVSAGNCLIDIVAAAMPPMPVLAALLAPATELEIRFPPDRLAGSFRAVPHVPEDDDHLMIRGPLAVADDPIILPPTALS